MGCINWFFIQTFLYSISSSIWITKLCFLYIRITLNQLMQVNKRNAYFNWTRTTDGHICFHVVYNFSIGPFPLTGVHLFLDKRPVFFATLFTMWCIFQTRRILLLHFLSLLVLVFYDHIVRMYQSSFYIMNNEVSPVINGRLSMFSVSTQELKRTPQYVNIKLAT